MTKDSFDEPEPLVIETEDEAARMLEAIRIGRAQRNKRKKSIDPEVLSTIKAIYHLRN